MKDGLILLVGSLPAADLPSLLKDSPFANASLSHVAGHLALSGYGTVFRGERSGYQAMFARCPWWDLERWPQLRTARHDYRDNYAFLEFWVTPEKDGVVRVYFAYVYG